MDKIVFLKETDYAFWTSLEAIKEYIDDEKIYEVNFDINNIIIQYIIKLYIDEKVIDRYVDYFDNINIKEISQIINANIGKFSDKYKNDILQQFGYVEIDYRKHFWGIIEHTKLYNHISTKQFKMFLDNNKFYLKDLLKNKGIVNKFDEEIQNYIVLNPLLIEDFITYHLVDDKNKSELYFPKSLDSKVIEEVVEVYLNSVDSNSNIIKLISECTKSDKIKLSDKIRLKAKKQYENLVEELFSSNIGFGIDYMFASKPDMNTEYYTEFKNSKYNVFISEKWISENLDYSTLLNNFIMFEFVNKHMIINSLAIEKHASIFFTISAASQDKNAYKMSREYEHINMHIRGALALYIKMLQHYNIYVEDILEWFFKNYLKDEFSIDNFNYNKSTDNSSYLEKCKNICSEMENVLRQYNCYVEEGNIDHELLSMSISPIRIENIQSKIINKYIYPNIESDLYKNITYLLFSNQSMLGYNKKTSEKYDNFYKLLINENVNLDDYEDYKLHKLNYLIDNGFVIVDENKNLKFKDINKVCLLYLLYTLDELNYWHLDERLLLAVEELYNDNMLYFKSSFFTKLESDYFDYHLNNSKFSNAKAIRNYYGHGNIADKNDARTHENNYTELIKLVVMIVIKINDELCTYSDIIEGRIVRKRYEEIS